MHLRHCVVIGAAFAAACSSTNAIEITNLGAAYAQDFDSLASSGTSDVLPEGWSVFETGENANAIHTAGAGSANAGDTYSFGAAGATERALGGLQSAKLLPLFGAYFENHTGGIIDALMIAYVGEQWRLGAAGRADRLDFQFSLDATSLVTGTWADWDALDFVAPVGATGQRDGNAPDNRIGIAAAITGIVLPNAATLWLRWSDFNATGADDGLGIDDFSLIARGPVTAPTQSVPDSLPMATCLGAVMLGLAATRYRRAGVGRAM